MRVLPLLLVLAACGPAPPVDVSRFEGRVPPSRPGFPALAPVEDVVAGTGAPNRPDAQSLAIQGPADGLRARAAALSGPVIPPEERGRLEDAIR